MRTPIQDFLGGLAATATGALAGSQAGQQAAQEENQRRIQQGLAQLTAQQQAQQLAQQPGMEAARFLGAQIPHLTPEGQAAAIGGISDFLARQPQGPYTPGAVSYVYSHHGQLPPAGFGVPAPHPAVSTPYTPINTKSGDMAPEPKAGTDVQTAAFTPGVTPSVPKEAMAGPAGLPAPATAPAPASPTSFKSPLGGQPLAVNAGPGKDRLARIGQRYQTILKAARDLPEGDPRRDALMKPLTSINLNPTDEAGAAATETALGQSELHLPENTAGLALTARGLKPAQEKFSGSMGTLADIAREDPSRAVDVLLSLRGDADTINQAATGLKLPAGLPPSWVANKKDIDRIAQLRASGKPEDEAEAEKLAGEVSGRLNSKLGPKEETAALNASMKLIKLLNPSDPKYTAQVKSILEAKGIGYLLPQAVGGLGGATFERYYQTQVGKLPSFGSLSKSAQAPFLQNLRQLAKLTGRDPNAIPDEILKQLSPLDQARLRETQQRIGAFETNQKIKEAAEARAEATFQTQQQRLQAKGSQGLTQAQTLAALHRSTVGAQKALDNLLRGLTATEADVDTSQLLPAENRKVKALIHARNEAQNREQAYFNRVQNSGTPTGGSVTVTTKTTAPAAEPQPRNRAEYFLRLKRERPGWSDEKINRLLDKYNVR